MLGLSRHLAFAGLLATTASLLLATMPSSSAAAASAAVVSAEEGGVAASPPSAFAVASYVPEWRYEGTNWETLCETVTHLILFSLEVTPDGGIAAWDRIPRAPLLQQAKVASKRTGTKLLICFGGNGRSDGFSPMVRSAAARAKFVSNLVKLCDDYGFDGVDLNWEYPGIPLPLSLSLSSSLSLPLSLFACLN